MAGREAHMIPTQHSMAVQIMISALSPIRLLDRISHGSWSEVVQTGDVGCIRHLEAVVYSECSDKYHTR